MLSRCSVTFGQFLNIHFLPNEYSQIFIVLMFEKSLYNSFKKWVEYLLWSGSAYVPGLSSDCSL